MASSDSSYSRCGHGEGVWRQECGCEKRRVRSRGPERCGHGEGVWRQECGCEKLRVRSRGPERCGHGEGVWRQEGGCEKRRVRSRGPERVRHRDRKVKAEEARPAMALIAVFVDGRRRMLA